MKGIKWFKSFLLILFALVIGMDFIALIIYFLAKLYVYFARDIEFSVDLPELLRIIRGASLGGVVAGIGCWYAYLKSERP
jgi:hypothetical protein